jgi:hypothetical protein
METFTNEDGHRVDIYEYDQQCVGVVFLIVPAFPYVGMENQILTVEYGPDGSFLTAEVLPDIESPKDFVEAREVETQERVRIEQECAIPFSEAVQLDATTQLMRASSCGRLGSVSVWRWKCLAAHQGNNDAQYSLARDYAWGFSLLQQDMVEAYKWSSLAAVDGSPGTSGYLAKNLHDSVARKMSSDQIAEAERLVAEWVPNPWECETIRAQAEN